MLVQAEIGLEEQARATAEAAYKRGAKFVDVAYFDPYVKRARIEHANPDTLDFVPEWYGERVLEHAEQNGARISMRSVTAPNVMDGLDKSLLGKDMLPSVKETFKVINERSTNWCFVPAPHPAWATLVHPDLPADEAYRAALARARARAAPRRARPARRLGRAHGGAERLRRAADGAAVRRDRAARAWNRADDRPAADCDLVDCRLLDREGFAAFLEPPDEEVFTTPDPRRTSGQSQRRSRSSSTTGRSSADSAFALKMALRSRSMPTRTQRRCVASPRSTRVRAGSVSSPSSTAGADRPARHCLL